MNKGGGLSYEECVCVCSVKRDRGYDAVCLHVHGLCVRGSMECERVIRTKGIKTVNRASSE